MIAIQSKRNYLELSLKINCVQGRNDTRRNCGQVRLVLSHEYVQPTIYRKISNVLLHPLKPIPHIGFGRGVIRLHRLHHRNL